MSSTKVICPTCDGINSHEATFCTHCGSVLSRTPLQAKDATTTSLASGSLLYERYRILEAIGRGGMGTVYKAEDIRLGQRLVAVKEVKLSGLKSQEELDKVLGAFEQEALLLAKLSHPSLPSIHDHFSDNGHWYIVMEYIRGETLSRRLRVIPDGRVAIDDVLNIGIKLCEVLGYLHAQKPPVIFSDLKPNNIMLTPERNLYLIDFGIARLYQTTLADGKVFVSEGYSPPEQYQHTQISPRADIYSLGATLYQMISGLHPSKPSSHHVYLHLGHLVWGIELEALIMSMLKNKEEERPPNIIVVKQALQRITNLRAQKQNIAIDSPAESKGTALWDIAYQTTSLEVRTSAEPISRSDKEDATPVSTPWNGQASIIDKVETEAKIRFLSGPLTEQVIKLPNSEILIGRDIQNYVCVQDPKVSRRHARLYHQEDSWMIENLSRTTFVAVNQQLVTQSILEHNAIVKLGENTSFVFLIQQVTSVPLPIATKVQAPIPPSWEVGPSLPTLVTHRDIQLSLSYITALAWSPNGQYLAAANKEEIHIYAWPPNDEQFTFEDEKLIPLRVWSLKDLGKRAGSLTEIELATTILLKDNGSDTEETVVGPTKTSQQKSFEQKE